MPDKLTSSAKELDGRVGTGPGGTILHGRDRAYWEARRATIERAAQAAPNTQ